MVTSTWRHRNAVVLCLIALVVTCVAFSASSARVPTPPDSELGTERKGHFETTVEIVAEPDAPGTYRGRILTADGSPLPADLKLQRRVSYEPTRNTPVDENGEFVFQTDSTRNSARFSITGSGFSPFDSKWIKLDQPIELTLVRGATIKLRLKGPRGTKTLKEGAASLIVPWWDEDEQGTFAVDENGLITIEHCPLTTVNLDLFVPGYEELRIRRLVREDLSLDVPLKPAKPTKLRVVSATDGLPIANAKIHFFSRTRDGSFLMPFRKYGAGPIWGQADADGRVSLTTLRAIDPVPSNDPGQATYCFRVDAPGYAPIFLGDIRSGDDLGEIQLSKALEVRGEIIRDAQNPEKISLQVRQPTIVHGGDDGRGGWNSVDLVPNGEQLTFHLKDLQAGPFELFIVYSEANQPPGSFRGNVQQLQFRGRLSDSSSGLVITREAVEPGDDHLQANSSNLSPAADFFHASNVPAPVLSKLENEFPETLFAWSSTAPVRHSGGRVDWKIFVLRDGTVFIPGGINREAGIHYKLSSDNLQELQELLEKHADLFGRQVPKELPKYASWERGHQTLSYTKEGQTKLFTKWYGFEEISLVGEIPTTTSRQEIEDYAQQLMTIAGMGGPEALENYREFANQALIAAIPQATPFTKDSWSNATNRTDGTREITFAVRDEHRTNVSLIDPAFGDPYIERIEHQGQRLPLGQTEHK